MTKKDFKLVKALIIRWTSGSGRALLLCKFANAFAEEYPNFNRAKWFKDYEMLEL